MSQTGSFLGDPGRSRSPDDQEAAWKDVGDIGIEDVPRPAIRDPADAIVRITASAICGTDLHFARGTMAGMRQDTILGHEAVGIVEETGPNVRNFDPGDRVVIPSTIGCGSCVNCRTFAHTNLVAIPPGVTDEQAVMVGDIFPTAWFRARLVQPGDVMAVFGAGPGWPARRPVRPDPGRGPGHDRRRQRGPAGDRVAAERRDINFNAPSAGPAAAESEQLAGRFAAERATTPRTNEQGGLWRPKDAPSQALRWAVESVAKAGTIGIIGVYPPQHEIFPVGAAMNRNLTIKAGNCNHRRYVPGPLSKIAAGTADPTTVVSQQADVSGAVEAYEFFDRREPGRPRSPSRLAADGTHRARGRVRRCALRCRRA